MKKDWFISEWKREFPIMVDVIKALSEENMDYRPHPKNRSARQLVGHLIGHLDDLIEMVDDGVINHRIESDFSDMNDALAQYEEKNLAFVEKLGNLSDADWHNKIVNFNLFGQTIYSFPISQGSWTLFLDNIHHRGQLSTYIRPMGGKIPSIYGPSADTMAAKHEA